MTSPEGDQPATDGAGASVGPGPVHLRRRRAVLAGHRRDLPAAVGATADADASVRAAGFGALARLGRLGARPLRRALADADPAVRRRAAELAGTLAARGRRWGPSALAALVDALADPDPLVVESAAAALGECGAGAPRAVAALADTARHHQDPLCREAAVAALGAAGAGLEAVLAALDDRPPVRRRAVVALAAFDDPRVDPALTAALDDRDWQVRQAAEDLLDRRGRRA